MRRFLAVFANFSIFTEVASQAYSLTIGLSTSKRRFFCFIKMSEDPLSVARFLPHHHEVQVRIFGVARGERAQQIDQSELAERFIRGQKPLPQDSTMGL